MELMHESIRLNRKGLRCAPHFESLLISGRRSRLLRYLFSLHLGKVTNFRTVRMAAAQTSDLSQDGIGDHGANDTCTVPRANDSEEKQDADLGSPEWATSPKNPVNWSWA